MMNPLRTSQYTPRSHVTTWQPENFKQFIKAINLLLVVLLLCVGKAVYAEEWYSIAEEPGGKTTQPPKQLEKYPLGQNTEKHFPPNMEFTLWTQDETLFKPEEKDKIEVKKVLEKETETFKLENAEPPARRPFRIPG